MVWTQGYQLFVRVIVQARVVFRKTVVGDWRFDYLCGSHLQSQVKRPSSDDGIYASGSQNVTNNSFSKDYIVPSLGRSHKTNKSINIIHTVYTHVPNQWISISSFQSPTTVFLSHPDDHARQTTNYIVVFILALFFPRCLPLPPCWYDYQKASCLW